MKVLARGELRVYPPRGEYQLTVQLLEPLCKGSLQQAFEELKQRLEREGLFDPARKRPLPMLPRRIGVVTSPTGAVLRDIVRVLRSRYQNLEVLVYPALVQGDGAAADIAQGLRALNRLGAQPGQALRQAAEGGLHGIGRVDLVEGRLVGVTSHGVYETPGGTILLAAHRELESLVLDKETIHFKDVVAMKDAELVYNGMWFAPLRESLAAFVDSTQGPVTGSVRLKLYKGNIIVAGRKSKFSLYREDFATFGQEDVYDQSDAEGFIRLYGLSLKVRALNGLPVSGLEMPQPDYSRFKRD